ncbi:cyclic nucleotide-binding domain-containing protein [Oxalobacteraceae bacterium OM1]|nr:cyclic nucleotide-binding domain-containing protein [Oxalobacteraceae bacterium OM1]
MEQRRLQDLSGRTHQMFPVLAAADIDVLRQYGDVQHFMAGDTLYAEGVRHNCMYVVLSGEVDVYRAGMNGDVLVTTHGPGHFTGEIGTLAGRAAVASGRARTATEALTIDEQQLRALVVAEADLSETIMRAFILRRVSLLQDTICGLVVVGTARSPDTLRLREFLSRNGHPHAYFDVDSEAAELLQRFNLPPDGIPALITPDGKAAIKPSNREAADLLGISPEPLDGRECDLLVVGAGPAGMAAAVYAASEGLRVLVLDTKAPGGQAGSSSKIENYFGFPTGISGQALAGRGLSQARKFGAEVAVPVCAVGLSCDGNQRYTLTTDLQERIRTRAVIVASGARYRKPDLPDLARYEGRGVYYNASFMESALCRGEDIAIVGGGNSAGQAAVFLSRYARKVHILVRSAGLAASMSRYLIQRIESAHNIELHPYTQVAALHGEDALESISCRAADGRMAQYPLSHLFLFLGAEPNTAWLNHCVALDGNGFALTGADIPAGAWPEQRPPHHLETSRPAIFAVGDVRCGSVKRVAAAVGEGAAAVQALHAVLART